MSLHPDAFSPCSAEAVDATEWAPDEDTKRSCQSKGKSEEECQNYVRVLLISGMTLFTCGTNAFTPVCMTRQVGNVSVVLDTVNGVARCPYDPRHNSTAMVTERGELYAATVIDFSGRDPRNTAVENDCGKVVFSRVARVCKNDMGGRFLLEDTWTTFMKARLNCSRSGEIPFYYNELQSTFYLPEQDLIYGIFTTNVNSISASAVCAFNLSAVTQAFNGPFRYQENPRTAWLSTPNPIPNFQDAQRLYLMNDVVQPLTVNPLLTQDNLRLSKLVVDIVQGRETLYHVMYIGTEYGTILKTLSTSNKSLQGCYLEELRLLPPGKIGPIKSLQILHSDRSLIVGLDDRLVKIPLERCSSYPSEVRNLTQDGGFGTWAPWQPCNHDDGEGSVSSCVCRSRSCDGPLARCGGVECKGPTIQVANCSRNGGWTPWSSWGQCSSSCGIGFEVRQRSCNNPRLDTRVECVWARGERRALVEDLVKTSGRTPSQPQGVRWGLWETWSSCSQPCSRGFRTRKRSCSTSEGRTNPSACCSASCGGGHYQRTRTCSNPPPASGGDICIGLHTEEALCNTHTCEVILPGQEEQSCGTFTLFQLVAVGSASFFAAALLSALAYSYCYQLNRASAESATLNKNNLHVNDETCNHFPSPLPASNMFATTYYPPSLGKYDFHPDSPCRTYLHS
ncbi:hypothetical protein F7725_009026 [Dissostichus mawsoni]|uniref:Sema domain-containing protein n=1 Tax=Dissostichus mawsoni TaxID=36200 RepID=A0A7J5Z8Y9_DISMA|nr:hypothetical protein F7725_009026 [Dissostichus mawsoni]